MQRDFAMPRTDSLRDLDLHLRDGVCLGLALEWLMSILQGHPWESPEDGFWQAIAQQRAYEIAHDTSRTDGGAQQECSAEAITWRYVSRTAHRTRLPYRRFRVEDSRQLVERITETVNDGSGIMLIVYLQHARHGGPLASHSLGFAAGPDGILRLCDPAGSQWSWPRQSEVTEAATEVVRYIEEPALRNGYVIRAVMVYKFGGRVQSDELRAYYDSSATIMPLPAAPSYRAAYFSGR